jgi:predicted RNase H-like HicB family nuclease
MCGKQNSKGDKMTNASIERRGEPRPWNFGGAPGVRTVSASHRSQMAPSWEQLKHTYSCRVHLCPEDEGGFSIYLPDLPGVASQGESEQEALANIKEAFQGVVEVYRESGNIPWQTNKKDKPSGAKELWILVDA